MHTFTQTYLGQQHLFLTGMVLAALLNLARQLKLVDELIYSRDLFIYRVLR